MSGSNEDRGRLRESRNLLLQRLDPADQALLAPDMQEISVACGTRLSGPDIPLDALYFPDTALVSLGEVMRSGQQVEIAVVGREGMVGWPALLGSDRSPHTAEVRVRAGTLLRIELAPLRAACRSSPSLAAALLPFVHVMIVQMARAIASHLQHSLDQRLARWLLMLHDRVGGDILLIQHDAIAASMSVRRASVTDQLHVLEGERLIRCRRGRVLVRDRAGLERYAGDAYGIPEEQYCSLIGPFGKSSPLPGTPGQQVLPGRRAH